MQRPNDLALFYILAIVKEWWVTMMVDSIKFTLFEFSSGGVLFYFYYLYDDGILYIYDDGIFTEVEILQDYFLVYKS